MRSAEQRHVLARARAQRLFVALALLCLACSKGSPPARGPTEAPSEPPPGDAPASATGSAEPTKESPLTLEALGPGVPPASGNCPEPTPLPTERVSCPNALADLAGALTGRTREGPSDVVLERLETCTGFPAGIVRALRADRLSQCADRVVELVVGPKAPPNQVDAATRQLLVALGLADRLSRLVGPLPSAPPRSSKAELEQYLQKVLFPWATEQAVAIGDLSRKGARLRGYARGIVAMAAADADLRFVEMARGLPLPTEMQDPEIKAEYYASLDEALEPRKDRARDAALVGLGEFSALGILRSNRLTGGRRSIARVFGGGRFVALDDLITPEHNPPCTHPLPQQPPLAPEVAVAASVDTPYVPLLLGETELNPMLRTCLLERGLSPWLARQLEGGDAEARLALARAHFEFGRTYLAAAGFQRAAALYADVRSGGTRLEPEHELLSALSTVLSAAPVSVVDLFSRGPRLPAAIGQVAPLDDVAKKYPKMAGAAAFDAAHLMELTAPDGSPNHFLEVAKRYEAAARSLTTWRKEAVRRAADARATAAALQKKLN